MTYDLDELVIRAVIITNKEANLIIRDIKVYNSINKDVCLLITLVLSLILSKSKESLYRLLYLTINLVYNNYLE